MPPSANSGAAAPALIVDILPASRIQRNRRFRCIHLIVTKGRRMHKKRCYILGFITEEVSNLYERGQRDYQRCASLSRGRQVWGASNLQLAVSVGIRGLCGRPGRAGYHCCEIRSPLGHYSEVAHEDKERVRKC